jgi:hypothetical protein
MGELIMNITSIISSLVKLGVNVTGQQYELIKWRTSDEAKLYYSKRENKKFYKAMKKGNIKILDAIRKDKQKRIDSLTKKLLRCILIVLLPMLLYSCSLIPKPQNSWDPNSLKETEKSYQIKEQNIKIQDKIGSVRFEDDWFLVHSDFIKTHNENQDNLLECLTLIDKQNNKTNKMVVYGGIGVFLVLLSFIIIFLKRRRKNESKIN